MASLSRPSAALPQVWLAAIVLAVLTAVLAVAYFMLMRRDYAVLYQDLRPTEAAAVVAELDSEGIVYELREGGTQILVPAAELDAVRLKVVAADLPVKGLDGFELFDDSDMGLTDFTQKIKYQRAIQGELARTIMRMDGIEEARVHISMPERSVFRGEAAQAKAAVAIVMRSADLETPERIEGVQQLVAAAVSNLSAADVVVINGRGEVISRKVDPEGATGGQIEGDATAIAMLSAALRRILTDRRFKLGFVNIPAPTKPASTGDAIEAVAAAAKPVSREALPTVQAIKVTTEAVLSAAEQDQITAEFRLVKATGISPESIVLFDVARLPATEPASIPSSTEVLTRPKPDQDPQAATTPPLSTNLRPGDAIIWIGAGIVAVVLTAVLLLQLRRTRPTLSLEDQRSFADRLKLGLQSRMGGRQPDATQ